MIISVSRLLEECSFCCVTIGTDRCFPHIATYSRRLRDEDILEMLDQCGGKSNDIERDKPFYPLAEASETKENPESNVDVVLSDVAIVASECCA